MLHANCKADNSHEISSLIFSLRMSSAITFWMVINSYYRSWRYYYCWMFLDPIFSVFVAINFAELWWHSLLQNAFHHQCNRTLLPEQCNRTVTCHSQGSSMVNVLKFRTPNGLTKCRMQTVLTQIRLLLQIRISTVCHSTKYFKKQLHKKHYLGQKSIEWSVQNFRTFTVVQLPFTICTLVLMSSHLVGGGHLFLMQIRLALAWQPWCYCETSCLYNILWTNGWSLPNFHGYIIWT